MWFGWQQPTQNKAAAAVRGCALTLPPPLPPQLGPEEVGQGHSGSLEEARHHCTGAVSKADPGAEKTVVAISWQWRHTDIAEVEAVCLHWAS